MDVVHCNDMVIEITEVMRVVNLDVEMEMEVRVEVEVVDKASEPWGIKVLRYEIKNINPPHDVLAAMEKQMRAEREKRALILTSEGERDAVINAAEGDKQQVIKASEASKQKQINEAEGEANAIRAVAEATADGIRKVAEAVSTEGGFEAVQLRVAENYIERFGELAKSTNTMLIPSNAADISSMIATAMSVIKHAGGGDSGSNPAPTEPPPAPAADSKRYPTSSQLSTAPRGS